MPKTQRVQKHIREGPSTMHPVINKIPIVQRILLFASPQVRFPVLCSTVCESWREVIVDLGTGQKIWENIVLSNLLALLIIPHNKEEESNNFPEFTVFDQLQYLFNQACVGGRVRVDARPIASEPIIWVVQQLLPLAYAHNTTVEDTIKDWLEAARRKQGPMDTSSTPLPKVISLKASIACPDFDRFPNEDDKKRKFRQQQHQPHHSAEIQELWNQRYAETFSYATRMDFWSSHVIYRSFSEIMDFDDDDYDSEDDDDDEIVTLTTTTGKFYSSRLGTAPLLFVVVGWGFEQVARLLLEHNNDTNNGLSPLDCFSSNGKSLFCLVSSRIYFGFRIAEMLVDFCEKGKEEELINSTDRTGSFPLFESIRVESETSSALWFRMQNSFLDSKFGKAFNINLNQQFGSHSGSQKNNSGKMVPPLPKGMTLLHFCAKYYGSSSGKPDDKNDKKVIICPWTKSSTLNSGLLPVAKELLKRGADATTIKDMKGKTAYDYAKENQNYSGGMYKLFKEYV